jgi:hypothetical protein
MFFCYSWHHVLDTGLFMVSRRHVQRNWDPRRSSPFGHRVTQQCFFFWFWLLPICGFSFALYDFLLLCASPSYQDRFGGPLYRFMFFFGVGPRYTESLLAPCLSLYTTSVVCTRSRKKNTHRRRHFSRLSYHDSITLLIVAFRCSRL